MKIATQNQAFFPSNIMEKFEYIKAMGFDGYEIDGKLLVENLAEVKAAIKATGLPVTTACGGYDGWIGDFIEERRLNGLQQIERILEAWRKWAARALSCLQPGECLPSVCRR
jgi:sugar phosphate isomerase/epimerase